MANGKISFDMFCKPANSFTFVFPSTNYSKKKIKNIPKRIYDTNEECNIKIAGI